MSVRNFSNVTTIGSLSGPLAASAASIAVSNFNSTPPAPFTATIDRNTATEEIVLVTGYAGGTANVTRGYDGTAAQAHTAGATIEHTAGAIEYTEANTHNNATSNVHGTTGSLVGAQGAQSIFDKTLVSPVLQADVTAGDAAVAYVPPGAEARNMFRGVGPDGLDKITVDSAGHIVSAGVAVTTLVSGATSAATNNALVQRDSTGGASVTTLTVNNAPTAVSDAARKDYVDTQVATKAAIAGDLGGTAAVPTVTSGAHHTHTSSQVSDAASAATASKVVVRDGSGRAQFADPSAAQDAATKNYVDTKPLARARRVANQSIPTNSFTTVVFDTVDIDTLGTQYATTGLTIRQAGYYRLAAGFTAGPAASGGRRAVVIYKGGTSTKIGRLAAGAGAEAGVECSGTAQLAVGDVLTIQVYQDTGSPQNTDSTSDYGQTCLEAEFLRP